MADITLSDGITLQTSEKGSGVKGASYDPSTARIETPFVALINRKDAIALDPRMQDFKAGGQMVHFGNFDDPRKAAYATAEFFQRPRATKQRLDLWFSLEKPSFRNGALGEYKFPPDLFENPELQAAIKPIMQKWKGQMDDQGARGRTYSNPNARSWIELIKTIGVRGGQIAKVLTDLGANDGNANKNIDAVLKAKDMSADDAINYLRKLGVDLDNPQHVAKIKQAQPLAESLSESQQQLDRIKQLIKY